MATIVECPACQRKLRVPEDLLGKPVKCPSCTYQFEAALTSAPLAGDVAVTTSPAGPRAAGPSAQPSPTVPAALEGPTLPADEELEGEERPWERSYRPAVRRDCEPHRGTLILVLGILSLVFGGLGLFLGLPAWIMGQRDLKKMRAKTMDPEGQGLTQAGWICGIIGTIFGSLSMLCCVAYLGFGFFMMTTVTPTPPPAATKPVSKPVPAKKDKDKIEGIRPRLELDNPERGQRP